MQLTSKRRVCKFCADSEAIIDYKNIDLLRHYLSNYSKIIPKKRNGNCAKHQRRLSQAIKRARFMSLLP